MNVLKANLLCATAALVCDPLLAQSTSAPDAAPSAAAPAPPAVDAPGEIVVTARKRQESLLNVPLIENVVPAVQLQRQQVVDLKDLTKLAPGLLIGTAVLSIGQLVSIRGVGTSSSDPGIDQSVSLNIDGLSLGQGLAYSSGLFDVGQVEVLKGPQALFYGKGSPGGVISLRTADPTSRFELIARGAYEAEARTRRGELVVSGPLTETLKARVAGMYSASAGYYYNRAFADPGTGALDPRYSRLGHSRNYQVRGTLLWDPDPAFSARLKLNLVRDKAVIPDNFQLTSCPDGTGAPFGIPWIGAGEDCRKDRTSRVVYYDPAAFPGVLNNGVPFVDNLQRFGTLELNYKLSPDLALTSVTGYYDLHSSSLVNTSFSNYAGPLIAAQNPRFRRHDLTQEVRLNSDFSRPINFTLGGFYQDGKVSDRITIIGNTALPFGLPAFPLNDGINAFTIKTYSAFGQLRWKIVPQLELAAGARYTDETRRQQQTLFTELSPAVIFPGTPPYNVPSPTPRIHASNVSPEVTLTYKPTTDLTLFAAYKKGYKSGSFSIATPAKVTTATPRAALTSRDFLDNSFNDERVQGGEAGIKGRLLDRRLDFSLAAYDYLYKGLQVGSIEPTVGNLPTIRTVNAGSGRAYGVEFNLGYRPPLVPGLGLNGSASWTHARFKRLDNVPCYGGQTAAAGCSRQFAVAAAGSPGTVTVNGQSGYYFAQDLSGVPFIRAPDWQASFGFDYERPIGGDMKLIFTNTNFYSSRFLTTLGRRDDYYQKGYLKMDLGVTLQGPRNRWEIAIIAKNVTEKLTTSNCNNSNFAAGLAGGQITGGTIGGPAGIDEVGCYMDPGREVWLRLTLRPFG